MKVYKYRGGNFKRDLFSIEKNYFWAPDYTNLNDPSETTITSDKLNQQRKFILPLLGRNNKKQLESVQASLDQLLGHSKKVGIYSLSKTFNDELLWAHYANSHTGFCIEYNLEALIKTYKNDNLYHFPVKYKKNPPSIEINDIINARDSNSIIQKMTGYKSLKWKYEEEIRIVIENYGEHAYDYHAITSIYFGLRMSDKEKSMLMDALKGRGIKYYQIKKAPDTYKLNHVPISDPNGEQITYLQQIQMVSIKNEILKYKIIEKEYNKYNGKATVLIELTSKVEIEDLNVIAKKIKTEVFRKAKRIFISWVLPNFIKGQGYWANSDYIEEELKSKINGLTIEQEKSLIEGLEKEDRNVIGTWLDETPYSCSTMILYQKNDEVYLETKFLDGSKSEEKIKVLKSRNGDIFESFMPSHTGGYITIDINKVLQFHAKEGVFRTLKAFTTKAFQS